MEFRILGPLEVEADGAPLPLGTLRQRQLLVLLLLREGHPVPTGELAEQLWAGRPPPTARHTVQVYVHRLRRAFGKEAGRLETRGDAYRLAIAPDELDARRFQALAEQGQDALAAADPGLAADLLSTALDLWRGPLLSGLDDMLACDPERARLDGLRLAAWEDRIDADLALGRHNWLVDEVESLLAEHPYRERLWGQLIVALYRSGRQADALAAFRRARHVLREQLGLEPGPRLADLEGRVLLQDPTLNAPASPRPLHYLPAARTSFVGRHRERADVEGLLAVRRLVTITGPPGSGKTRLALEVARASAAHYPHGGFFVSLADVTDPALVPSMIAGGVGAWAADQSPEAALQVYLRPRRLLLVLDNFEHVLDGADVVGWLLDAADGLTVLATSRAPLRLSGEQEYPLQPLPLPPTGDSAAGSDTSEALALFADRAKAVDPGFTLDHETLPPATEVVTRVDGLPLAIELAAARLRLFRLPELAARLDPALPELVRGAADLPARQRTLRDAIGWSYDLFDPPTQRLLRRLAVFRGGFTLAAASAVASPPAADLRPEVAELVEGLVEGGLVQRPAGTGPARFSLLETVREYALQRLWAADPAGGEARDAGHRHFEFFAELAARATHHLVGPERDDWLSRLGAEDANLRVALGWARDHATEQADTEQGVAEQGMLMAGRLWRYWQLRGHLAEGRLWLEQLLAAGPDAPGVPRVTALIGLGGACYWQADFDAAEACYWQALEQLETLDAWELQAEALWGQVSTLTCQVGRLDTAARLEQEFISLAGAHSELAPMVNAVSGAVRLLAGDLAGARRHAEAGVAIARDTGLMWLEGEATRALGHISFEQGRYMGAGDHLRRSLRLAWETGNMPGVVTDLRWLGRMAVAHGRPADGVLLAGAAARLQETVGGGLPVQALAFRAEAPEAAAARLLGDLEIERAWARGHAMGTAAAVELALSLPGLDES